MFYIETAASQTPQGRPRGYPTKAQALEDAKIVSHNMDIPIDIVEIRDADRVYPCGCSDNYGCPLCDGFGNHTKEEV